MTPEDRRNSAKTGTLVSLITVQTLGVFSLVPWSVGAMFTLISIGPGGWIPPWIIAVWLYPFVLVAFSGAAWGLFARERYTAAAIVTLLPFALVAAVFAVTYVVEVATAIAAG